MWRAGGAYMHLSLCACASDSLNNHFMRVVRACVCHTCDRLRTNRWDLWRENSQICVCEFMYVRVRVYESTIHVHWSAGYWFPGDVIWCSQTRTYAFRPSQAHMLACTICVPAALQSICTHSGTLVWHLYVEISQRIIVWCRVTSSPNIIYSFLYAPTRALGRRPTPWHRSRKVICAEISGARHQTDRPTDTQTHTHTLTRIRRTVIAITIAHGTSARARVRARGQVTSGSDCMRGHTQTQM